jgi:hypothetical protein
MEGGVFQPGAPCARHRQAHASPIKLPVNCSRPPGQAGEPCAGADRPELEPAEPDSPAGLLDSAKGFPDRARAAGARQTAPGRSAGAADGGCIGQTQPPDSVRRTASHFMGLCRQVTTNSRPPEIGSESSTPGPGASPCLVPSSRRLSQWSDHAAAGAKLA